MTRTLAWLILTMFRNRLRAMARRVRKPRYAIGLILGIAYVALFVWGQMVGAREARAGLLQNDVARTLAPAMLALVLLSTWFGGATLSALAFTQAEVSLLFPAPVSRRALILYKLGTAQLPIIINALILAYLFGRGPAAIPRWLAPVSLWTVFSTLHLHRLGAALAHASALEHGRSGLRRNWFSHVAGLLIFGGIMAAFMSAPMGAIGAEGNGGAASGSGLPLALLGPIADALSTPAAQLALSPFAFIIAPAFARSVGEWMQAMGPALLVLALHAWWVLRSQVAFEEAAVEASGRRQRAIDAWRQRGRAPGPRSGGAAPRTFSLAPLGPPALGIVWKNILCFIRTFRPMQLIASMMVPAIVGTYLGLRAGEGAATIAGMCALFALLLLLTGGATVRNDLRADMLNLVQLKTLPLRGRDIVLAEVASSAVPLGLMQLGLLLIALAALQNSRFALDAGVAISIAVSLPFGLAGANLLTSTIRNGAAVLFPSWARLGVEAGGPGGLEVVGQTMLSMFAMFIAFVVLMIVPALFTLFVVLYVQPPAAVAIVFSVVTGAAAVAGECHLLIRWLGRAFERTEPSPSITAS